MTQSMSQQAEDETRQRSRALADLRWHWGDAYQISFVHGMFRAERRDDGAAVSAASASALRDLIRDDYAARPVPRRCDPGPGGR